MAGVFNKFIFTHFNSPTASTITTARLQNGLPAESHQLLLAKHANLIETEALQRTHIGITYGARPTHLTQMRLGFAHPTETIKHWVRSSEELEQESVLERSLKSICTLGYKDLASPLLILTTY